MTKTKSSNKRKRLTGDEIEYIHRNYKGKTYQQIADEIGVTKGTIFNQVKKAGLRKREYASDYDVDKIREFIKPYHGKVTITELHEIYLKQEDISIDTFRRIVKKLGFVNFIGQSKTRLYLDGCPENLTPSNLIVIPHDYRHHFKKDRFGELTGEALITALHLIDFQKSIDDFNIYYAATNMQTGEVVENESASKLCGEIGFERNAYWKRKTIGENGGKIIGDWEVVKIIKETV